MSPLCRESHPLCRLKNPTVISTWLLLGFHPATRSVQFTPADNARKLGPSIDGLVTYGNTKLCCQAFILALFHSPTAKKIDKQIRDNKKLLPVCEVEKLQVTGTKIDVFPPL